MRSSDSTHSPCVAHAPPDKPVRPPDGTRAIRCRFAHCTIACTSAQLVGNTTPEAQAAEQYKRKLILEGEGEAAKKRLVMEADGALDAKLKAYVDVNKEYASAIKNAQPGAWVPVVNMESGNGKGGNSAQALMDMFAAKTARDMGVDLQAAGAAKTVKK